jgi:curved DNA-binding protein CbpA
LSSDRDRSYELLGVRPGVSPGELKAAYRDLIKVWHPDRFGHDPRLKEKAQEKLKEINEAYEELSSGRRWRIHVRPQSAAPRDFSKQTDRIPARLLVSRIVSSVSYFPSSSLVQSSFSRLGFLSIRSADIRTLQSNRQLNGPSATLLSRPPVLRRAQDPQKRLLRILNLLRSRHYQLRL